MIPNQADLQHVWLPEICKSFTKLMTKCKDMLCLLRISEKWRKKVKTKSPKILEAMRKSKIFICCICLPRHVSAHAHGRRMQQWRSGKNPISDQFHISSTTLPGKIGNPVHRVGTQAKSSGREYNFSEGASCETDRMAGRIGGDYLIGSNPRGRLNGISAMLKSGSLAENVPGENI